MQPLGVKRSAPVKQTVKKQKKYFLNSTLLSGIHVFRKDL